MVLPLPAAICGAIAVWFVLASSTVADDAFFSGIADLPLMPGLIEDDEAGLVFDKPDGRIVEVYASGITTPSAVADFYQRTLPQLGWSQLGLLEFTREGEALRITVTKENGTSVARFALSPRPQE